MSIDLDLRELDDEYLDQLRVDVLTEQERRNRVAEAPSRVEQAQRDYADAIGRKDGDPWDQPVGAHDAYALDAVVAHDGKEWESLVSNNVWEPGVSGWREKVTEGEVPDWSAPSGGHDAYNEGDRARFEGEVYRSKINGNTWSPAEYPQGWEKED